jgi:hypothetical protein
MQCVFFQDRYYKPPDGTSGMQTEQWLLEWSGGVSCEGVHISSYAFMYSTVQQAAAGSSALSGPNISGQVKHVVFPLSEVCTHIPTHTHTHLHTYIHTYTHIHTYIYTYIICAYVRSCMHAYVHTCVRACVVRTYIRKYILRTYARIYIHIPTYIHTYTHTHTHAQRVQKVKTDRPLTSTGRARVICAAATCDRFLLSGRFS